MKQVACIMLRIAIFLIAVLWVAGWTISPVVTVLVCFGDWSSDRVQVSQEHANIVGAAAIACVGAMYFGWASAMGVWNLLYRHGSRSE